MKLWEKYLDEGNVLWNSQNATPHIYSKVVFTAYIYVEYFKIGSFSRTFSHPLDYK